MQKNGVTIASKEEFRYKWFCGSFHVWLSDRNSWTHLGEYLMYAWLDFVTKLQKYIYFTYSSWTTKIVIFKQLSYCFEETLGFDVKASLASRPVSRLIRLYNKPGDITKEFWEKTIQFHRNFHRLKIDLFTVGNALWVIGTNFT